MARAWHVCAAAFVENRRAALVLGLLAGAVALAYALLPGFAAFLEPLRRWQETGGAPAVLVCQAFFCGVVPGLIFLACPASRPKRPFAVCTAQALWFGALGLACVAFYAVQDRLFGTDRAFAPLAAKTLVDQLLFNPLFLAPLHAAFFFWASRDFSWARAKGELPAGFYRNLVLPNLLANWIVSFPVVFSAYALPAALRLPMMGFVGAFWSVLCLRIGRHSSDAPV